MSTRISHIKLVNFRGFEDMELALHPQLNVFLGDNGSGKTSVIHAVSLLLSGIFPHCNYWPSIPALPFSAQNIRCRTERVKDKNRLVLAELSACRLTLEHEDESSGYNFALSAGVRTRAALPIPDIGTHEKVAAIYNQLADELKGIPVFAHYGPHRAAPHAEPASADEVNYTSPFSAYINALQPNLDFAAFLDWFNEEEAGELRERRHHPSFFSRELDAVRRALSCVLENGEMRLDNPRFETNPKRFVMDAVSPDGSVAELQFDQLSDGYRGMIALVADFARRLALANQYTDIDPLLGEGILIIDEVDAHLHPKWQYRVVHDLSRTFPNVQLIVTTHSPEVVSGVSRESVFLLAPQKGVQKEVHPAVQTEGNYPQLIAREVMGAPNGVENHPAYRAYLDCLAWIQAGEVETAAFERSRRIMAEHYGTDDALTQEVDARLVGLRRRRELLAGLKQRVKK